MTERVVLVSDLHLGGGVAMEQRFGRHYAEEFHDDVEFAEFLADQHARGPARLVLLGDTFDFLRVPVTGERVGLYARSDQEAVGQLRALVQAHPVVVQALATWVQQGNGLHLVAGNHDVELVRPAVQQELVRHLGEGVTVHPFLVHLPGLLHAQHGHHHHDINTFRNPLDPVGRTGAAERPPAARLHGLRAVVDQPGAFRREAASALRSRRSSRVLPDTQDPRVGGGLPEPVLAELLALGSTSLLRIARRVARQLARKAGLGRGGERAPYGPAAAERVRDVLERYGCGVPFYVLGHTHAAQLEPLAPGAWYLNTGTWSCDVRGAGSQRRTWVEVEGGLASLWRWAGRPERLAGSGDLVRVV